VEEPEEPVDEYTLALLPLLLLLLLPLLLLPLLLLPLLPVADPSPPDDAAAARTLTHSGLCGPWGGRALVARPSTRNCT
jgi:hypothetical protein